MSVAGKIIKTVNRMSARRFEAATQDVAGVQTAKIMGMIEANARTEYGQRYGFDKISTIAARRQTRSNQAAHHRPMRSTRGAVTAGRLAGRWCRRSRPSQA